MNSTVFGVDEYGNDAGLVSSGYVGEIKMFGFSGVPAHCLACDGSLLSIAAYPELYAVLGTLYGGDGVTTFALPTAENVIYAAGNGRAVGAAVAEGLPNITADTGMLQLRGSVDSQNGHGCLYSASGAFSVAQNDNVSNTGSVVSVGTQTRDNYFYFNASSANPIYGASSHVQPKGTAFNVCIVYE